MTRTSSRCSSAGCPQSARDCARETRLRAGVLGRHDPGNPEADRSDPSRGRGVPSGHGKRSLHRNLPPRRGPNFNSLLNTDEGTLDPLHGGIDLSPRVRIYRAGGLSSVAPRSDRRCPSLANSSPAGCHHNLRLSPSGFSRRWDTPAGEAARAGTLLKGPFTQEVHASRGVTGLSRRFGLSCCLLTMPR